MKNYQTAIITGASKGFGFALAENLAHKGWRLLINARHADQLLKARNYLAGLTDVLAISGDVRDEIHLLQITEALQMNNWKVDLVINNASSLGITPRRMLLEHPVEDLHTVFHTNLIAPLSLLQKIKPFLTRNASIINVSSDAAKEAYERWGAYGGSKAALDHITAILGKEYPAWRFYSFDPGDMQTDMQQDAFPGEDISDRPLPAEKAVPACLGLITGDLPSGRYTVELLKKEMV
ncbi:MAG TPA: SDR family oxidoreductase [Bacteroidales bacterium]|jgi:NAD(P)-dependent dehydrogenase (short-subunit alcohol dehydrogenase family)|nr:SDR family oxidoreductase [Bacteroidales bacterium]